MQKIAIQKSVKEGRRVPPPPPQVPLLLCAMPMAGTVVAHCHATHRFAPELAQAAFWQHAVALPVLACLLPVLLTVLTGGGDPMGTTPALP